MRGNIIPSRNEFEKILKERNVKALKRCIQNNEITDEMYKTMFVSYCSSTQYIRYMFDFFQHHYNDVDKNAVEITDILLKTYQFAI
ncbi:MAG: hypothetical protein PV340_02635 [Wolbachia sp.]|nr:hypothetical protein [Wolbachia sp.]MDD9336785.1 hypothetical protein [Wolbachia sp.]